MVRYTIEIEAITYFHKHFEQSSMVGLFHHKTLPIIASHEVNGTWSLDYKESNGLHAICIWKPLDKAMHLVRQCKMDNGRPFPS